MITIFLPLLISAWQHVGYSCAAIQAHAIVQQCESGAIYGPALDLAGGWRIAADVQVQPAADGRFWAGLALNADIRADDRYAEVAIERGIEPFWSDDRSYGVQLSTPADRCCDRLLPAGDGWHHLEIVYHAGRADLAIDGIHQAVAIDLGSTASVELLCVAVDPGESKPGNTATCTWQSLEITHAP